MATKEIVLTTSRLNSHSTRVLTQGVDFEQYSKNPVLLWMHIRSSRWSDNSILPIGKLENIRVDGDKIIATPVFDEEDDFALKIKKKFDKGIINMCSIGIDILESSNDPSLLVPGQRYETITKSKLTEVSMVDIGANDDALVVMYKDGNRIELSGGSQIIPLLPIKNEQTSMKKVLLKLGLPETANEDEVLAEIENCKKQDKEELTKLKKEIEQMQLTDIACEVKDAVKKGIITADKTKHFEQLGKDKGLEFLKATFAAFEPTVRPKDIISKSSKSSKEASAWLEMSDKDKIELRANDPETYIQIFEAEYGFKPTIK